MAKDYLITSDLNVCGGKPVVRGTRVPLQYIIELWERGYTADEIHEQYPTVPKQLIPKVIDLVARKHLIKIAW